MTKNKAFFLDLDMRRLYVCYLFNLTNARFQCFSSKDFYIMEGLSHISSLTAHE